MPQNTEVAELTCPKCKVKFTINDFIETEESTANFNNFFEKLYSNKIDEIKTKAQDEYEQKIQERKKSIEDSIKLDCEKEFSSKKDKLNNEIADLQETINNQKIEISNLNNSINNNNTQKNLDIKTEIKKNTQDLEKKYNEEIKKITDERKELSNKNEEKNIEIKTLINKIHMLELANAQNKPTPAIEGKDWEDRVRKELVTAFQQDVIEKITDNKGVKKADFIHNIKSDSSDEIIGSIIYEIKGNEKWAHKWEDKFSNDIKRKKGNCGILVAKAFCNKYGENKLFVASQKYENMYFTSPQSATTIAHLLRWFIIYKKQVQQSTNNLTQAQEKIRKIDEWFNNTFKTKIKETETSIGELNKIYENINNQMAPFKENLKILQGRLITDIKNALETILKEK